ncbi:MAG: exodeoxyribonuclease VII small subunit [Tepidiformaceae bacterium]
MAEQSFEELYTALEEKARRLEQGNLGLEESLKLYADGAALVEALRVILEAAELQVKTLQGRLETDVSGLREVDEEYDFDED